MLSWCYAAVFMLLGNKDSDVYGKIEEKYDHVYDGVITFTRPLSTFIYPDVQEYTQFDDRVDIMINETSEQIRNRFLELNVDIEPQKIERQLRDLTERFKVPIAEAQRSVVSYYLRQFNIKQEDYYDTTQIASSLQMDEYTIIDEILNRIDSLYANFENTSEYMENYNGKYNVISGYSIEILNTEKSKSYATLLTNLASKNLAEANNIITEVSEKLEKLRKLTLSEIAHRKLKEIEFQIDNPFFFRKLRRDYRTLFNELDKLDRAATKSDTENIGNLVSKFESIIGRSEDFEYEIEDEKKSGLYNSIGKFAFWGIPILIGLYQLIAMQYLTLNPYLPLVAYIIALSTIYLFLKSVTWIKFLYIGLKTDKSSRFQFILFMSLLVLIVYVNVWGKAQTDSSPVSSMISMIFMILVIIVVVIGVYLLTKQIFERIKNDLIKNELEDLAVEYGIKE